MIIKLKSDILRDKYTDYVIKNFDIQNKHQTTKNIMMNLQEIDTFDWNIGVIYGGSGSGKTTILNNIGTIKNPKFDKKKSLISNFNMLNPQNASKLLTSIGLSSIPSWLRPYNLLSNGEQYRAKLAYLIATSSEKDLILVDEYTSVVDRMVAKSMSNALQRYIRRSRKKIILASCHYDIIDWLKPDWVYSPLKGILSKKKIGKIKQLNYKLVESSLKLGSCSKSITI